MKCLVCRQRPARAGSVTGRCDSCIKTRKQPTKRPPSPCVMTRALVHQAPRFQV